MPRGTVNLTLDRDLLVILLYQASLQGCSTNEVIENLVYSAIRAGAEAEPERWDLGYLDDVYGQIHSYWERPAPVEANEPRLPF